MGDNTRTRTNGDAAVTQPVIGAKHVMPTEALPEDDETTTSTPPPPPSTALTQPPSPPSNAGNLENGGRYQSHAPTPYFQPTDDTQWASQEAGHLTFLILDCQKEEPLFRGKLGAEPKFVLDVGMGKADWAVDVADKYPHLTVHGVNLFPPPQTWLPPNCILEVDDVLRSWAWKNKWDLIHMRYMLGSFSDTPGGWIEHVDSDIGWYTDDNSLPDDTPLSHSNWLSLIMGCSKRAGRPLAAYDHMRSRIEGAGYTNVHEQAYKLPIGTWPKHPIYKDAGRVALIWSLTGLEGWIMWLLTPFGQPKPWSADEVAAYLEVLKTEINSGHRVHVKLRRVWRQKPFDAPVDDDEEA